MYAPKPQPACDPYDKDAIVKYFQSLITDLQNGDISFEELLAIPLDGVYSLAYMHALASFATDKHMSLDEKRMCFYALLYNLPSDTLVVVIDEFKESILSGPQPCIELGLPPMEFYLFGTLNSPQKSSKPKNILNNNGPEPAAEVNPLSKLVDDQPRHAYTDILVPFFKFIQAELGGSVNRSIPEFQEPDAWERFKELFDANLKTLQLLHGSLKNPSRRQTAPSIYERLETAAQAINKTTAPVVKGNGAEIIVMDFGRG